MKSGMASGKFKGGYPEQVCAQQIKLDVLEEVRKSSRLKKHLTLSNSVLSLPGAD
jgi:hypothetical protein